VNFLPFLIPRKFRNLRFRKFTATAQPVRPDMQLLPLLGALTPPYGTGLEVSEFEWLR